MRKLIALSLVAALIVAFTPGLVFAAGYDAPVGGESPHAGWTTTSDQCKQCHAVHKAEGNRFLLRSSNSRANDCAYCHLDGGSGAGFDVYTNNLLNGHTMGALGGKNWASQARTSRNDSQGRVIVPDKQGNTTDYRGGGAMDPTKATAIGYGRPGDANYVAGLGETTPTPNVRTRTGSLSTDQGRKESTFNCNACHMAHANPEKSITWRFLSLNPNARTRNASGLYMYYGPEWPNYKNLAGSRLAAGNVRTLAGTLTTKILLRDPTDGTANTVYEYDEAAARNSGERRKALTRWCADCHNLNVMGPGMDYRLNDTAPRYGYYDSSAPRTGGFWYSHSTAFNTSPLGSTKNIARIYKAAAVAGNYVNVAGAIAPSCYDCHVGYGSSDDLPKDAATSLSDLRDENADYDPFAYSAIPDNQLRYYNDWPHSGATESYALLKTIPKRMTAGETVADPTDLIDISQAGADPYSQDPALQGAGLDNVCRQCHAVVNRDPGEIYFDNTEPAGVFTNTWATSPGP